MSKHLMEVFASMFHVQLLETIQPEPCNVKGTMDIIIEERNADDTPWLGQAVRFVKVCHSQNECTHYEIEIDPKTGLGSITLQDVQAMKYRLVQVDECGTQMVDQDLFDISYMVDDMAQEQDYAEVSFEHTNQHATVRIINRRLQAASLHLQKTLHDRNGNVCELCDDMEFLIRISRSDGFERFIKLNQKNHFECQLCDLRAGMYTIEEYEYCDYEPYYRMNDNEATTSTLFELKPGNNHMEIINVERINTQLTVSKYVRNGCGEFCKPSCFEEFEIRIISDEQEECIILCEENDFCATLYGLTPGFYDIREVNCDERLYETTYIIDNGDESCNASLEICEGIAREVWVINSNIEREYNGIEQEAPLRICKYIRRCDGCIVKPDQDCQFKVMICGCGLQEAFYLNAGNNFCMDMASLCNGEYEIKEISCNDYITSYSINGECEKTSACICYDGSQNFCVSIINEERNRGSIRICKYIRNEFGDLIRPKKSQCFYGTLSSYFTRRCFELNEENDFTVCFDDLRFGSYEIREDETCDYVTSYQVNCEREKAYARLTVDDGCDNEIKIINSVPHDNCGVLKISKFIETAGKELVKPTRDEEFTVWVSGECFEECYTLRASNNWCIQLEGLAQGEYSIKEQTDCCYDVSYLINKEACCEAIVCMGNCNQEVCIINRAKQSGTLRINAVIRTCDGCMETPDPCHAFDILIEGSDSCLNVCLNADNNWCVELDELCEGKYRIIQKDNMGYKVSYFVHGREDSFGKIRLGSQDEEVTIINEETACMGNVIVTKYMLEEDGSLSMPCAQDEFHFELKSRCFSHTYTLRKRNDFCVYFDDLEEGSYEVCELEEDYEVAYRINGEDVERACFTLGREDVYVDIINAQKQQAALHIQKCIRKGTSFMKPNPCDQFQILLKGKNCHEIYELNEENDFCITIDHLCRQHYEIKELNATGKVCYEVDGIMQEDGYILFDEEDIQMTIINEETLYGCMEIKKMIAGEDGRLLRPSRYECFEVMVESDCFKQKVLLQKENDFCVRLYDLPQGHYEIHELGNEGYVSYLINDLPYESACVDVCEEDNCITVINHPCAKGSLCFKGYVEENGCKRELRSKESVTLEVSCGDECKEITLNCANDFCACLSDVLPGNYLLQGVTKESIRFEMEGQCFKDNVCVELNGEDVCIDVIVEKESGATLTIHKCMMDARGNLNTPSSNESFDFILRHDQQETCFTLNKQNQFTQRFFNQPRGEYELLEKDQKEFYLQVKPGGIEKKNCFQMNDCDLEVLAINKRVSNAWLHVEARIQSCDGHLIKPCGPACFQMRIYGNGMDETVVLDAKNAWHTKLHLEEGSYCVEQLTSDAYCGVSYLLNDHNVDQVRVDICDEDQYVTALNLECCAKGSIEICKLIRDEEGCYRYPSKEDEYWVTVQGEQDRQRVALNAQNHFYACLRNLCDGCYEVREESGQEGVEYVVNNAACTKKGIVHVAGNVNTVNIINPYVPKDTGSIMLNKYMSNAEGLLMKPQKGTYRIHISKPGYNEIFYLTKENGYHINVTNLENGLYVVDEIDHEGVSYIVNGGSQVDQASVEVMSNENQVDIINPAPMMTKGSITLAKYIRENTQLMRPDAQDSYVFLVSRPGYSQLFTLDAQNQWMTTIDNLEDGDYVISETTNTDQVSYIINGGSEVDRAIVSVAGNSNTVQIINTRMAMKGSLTMRKYVRDENQNLIDPSADFTTRVHISSPGYNKVVTLNQENKWTYTLQGLNSGMYVVDEIDSSNHVTYIVDNGSEVDRAIVDIQNQAHQVDIINQTTTGAKGSIHIEKYVREGMRLRRPQGAFRATLYISRPGYQQVFTLDASNDWMVDVTNLENGLYVLDEVSTQDQVSYIINGGSEVANGVVSVEDNANMVMMIDTIGKPKSSIQLAKFLRANDGTLITPQQDQSFTIEVRGDDQYRNSVELNRDNQWTKTLSNLKNGYYEIEEVSAQGYSVSYIVDNGLETNNASIRLLDNAHTVSVINSSEATLGRLEIKKLIKNGDGTLIVPADGDEYVVRITNEVVDRRVQLNSGNGFTAVLQDLPQGEYRIVEVESFQYLTTYRINGEPEVQIAYVTMATGTTNTVEVINELLGNRNTIEVFKYMLDNDGNYLPPEAPNVYSFTITGLDNGISQTYELNVDNSWHQRITTLPNGRYQIKENGTSPYPIKYLVNSAELKEDAIFTARAGTTQVIGIINTMRNDGQGNLTLTKRMRDRYDRLSLPQNGEVFTLNVSTNESNQIVTLEPDNNYTFTMQEIPFGVYTVEEVMSDYQVTYRVNDGIEMQNGIVDVDSTAMNTVVVINSLANTTSTSLPVQNSVKVVLE